MSSPIQHANHIASQAGLTQQRIPSGLFVLNTYSRIHQPNKPIHIYIEGDGLAWKNKHQASDDPTPRDALALKLASVDKADNVVYIARPCQFHDFATSSCNSTYWTDKRFSEDVVTAINTAITHFVTQMQPSQVHLIGYSGGGAIAMLVATKRNDVTSIRTVAGNLDHVRLNQHHQVSAMPASLNPIDFAAQLAHIPQIHFVGTYDSVVPKWIADAFISNLAENNCARVMEVPHTSHTEGWVEIWPTLLTEPACR